MRTTVPRPPATPAEPARFKQSLALAVLLPLVLAAALAGLFLWQISRLLAASQSVERTDEVIARANHAQRLLVDLETGLRGYLITGRREFLEPYERAARDLDPAFDNLKDSSRTIRRRGGGWTKSAGSASSG